MQARRLLRCSQAGLHEFSHVVDIAKVVLKTINAVTLAEPSEFNVVHPQEEAEDGAPLELLTQYKAAYPAGAVPCGGGEGCQAVQALRP